MIVGSFRSQRLDLLFGKRLGVASRTGLAESRFQCLKLLCGEHAQCFLERILLSHNALPCCKRPVVAYAVCSVRSLLAPRNSKISLVCDTAHDHNKNENITGKLCYHLSGLPQRYGVKRT